MPVPVQALVAAGLSLQHALGARLLLPSLWHMPHADAAVLTLLGEALELHDTHGSPQLDTFIAGLVQSPTIQAAASSPLWPKAAATAYMTWAAGSAPSQARLQALCDLAILLHK